ncbi:T9SS type A sorting domain-containing protein [candidate division WOR-3 bacterium]|nr:T9SS type A sorting domain-containing protein [candidate division WOR-3 bacterium]
MEFYTECDSATELEIEVGANLDTIQIAGSSYSWYEQNVATGTDTLELTIRKLSRDGFVPVSRVIVRRRSDSGIFMMGSPGEDMMPLEIPFCLYQPFPNSFGNAATIRYSLPYATHVSLKVYDVSGRLVNKLVDEEVAPGIHTLQWTGKDDLNRKCASGVYFVRFVADDYTASKKMVLIK